MSRYLQQEGVLPDRPDPLERERDYYARHEAEEPDEREKKLVEELSERRVEPPKVNPPAGRS